jgi:hypothetical protein
MADLISMLAAAAGSGGPTDPDFNQTTLLLHGDGTNGAQNNTFLDGSTNNFTITRNGNTTQGTFSPFSVGAGEFSNFFDETGDFLTAAVNSAFDPGSGSFTIEAWVYNQTSDTTNSKYIVTNRPIGASVSGFGFFIGADNLLGFLGWDAGGTVIVISSSNAVSRNAWNHVAVVKNGTTWTLYINGNADTSGTQTNNIAAATNDLYIGREPNVTTRDWNGYISNFRIVKSAVYTSGFTPPTAPLTAISNTSLLTCQSNRFVDNSTNAFAITRNGDVKVTPFSPFAPSAAYDPAVNGGSGYFDGTGDYLSIADNAAFAFGSGDFTIEFWVYMTGAAQQFFVSQWSSPQRSWAFLVKNSGTTLSFVHSTTGSNEVQTDGSISAQANTWAHFAAVRNGNSLKTYMNGTQIGSRDVTGVTLYDASQAVEIGRNPEGTTTWNLTGYISNVRVVKGTAVYTAAFTPPTAPLTAITNTSLLCNFTNAGIFDNTGKNNLETVADAQIDTTTKKYGTGSMEFDGTGDYCLVVPPTSDLFAFGTGDFTVECWVYVTTVAPTYQVIWDARTADPSFGSHLVINLGKMTWWLNGASRIQDSAAMSINTWYHVAVARSGTSTKMFMNGTQVGSTYTDSNSYISRSVPRIGISFDGSPVNPLNGFIDDLRITKGVARYTAAFTPPTAAFPNE